MFCFLNDEFDTVKFISFVKLHLKSKARFVLDRNLLNRSQNEYCGGTCVSTSRIKRTEYNLKTIKRSVINCVNIGGYV